MWCGSRTAVQVVADCPPSAAAAVPPQCASALARALPDALAPGKRQKAGAASANAQKQDALVR